MIEKGWIGGGNSGRNTTVIRSNYLNDESAAIYQHALDLWKTLGRELDFNIMMSHRGVLNLAHDEGEARQLRRRVEANRLNGIDAEWLEPDEVKEFCPPISISPIARYPVIGATLQRSGGTNRHDAVVWGYARAADAMGVDIIQQCEVTNILTDGRRGDRRRDDARHDPHRQGRLRDRRAYQRHRQDGRAASCRSKAIRCRRSSPSRSSRSSPASSCRTPCMSMSASPTRASSSSAPASTPM